ncbi:MAG: hemolysin family protein [Gemmatimonadota bacterium]|nr:hemolysin family protein [Gemmatimonadota bacterium]MDH4347389.1 hemolysin family protein [Gemmatimonadota bacterium]
MDDPESTSIAARLTAVILLVLLNAFFVAAEFALVGARRTRLDEMAQRGDRKAALARKATQSLDRYISATQLGITLASLGLGWIGEPALASVVHGALGWLPGTLDEIAAHGISIAIAFTIITALHIILGELMPKAVALLYPEQVSAYLAAPLMGFAWLMAGPIAVLNGTANRLLRIGGIRPPRDHERLHSPEEIRMLVEQSEVGGSLGKEDARLLEGVFEFSEKTAQEVMTPRTQMVTMDRDLTVEAAADIVADARRSRYPVCSESLDDVVGVVHAKDILTAVRREPGALVGAIMRPPVFVPGTREVEDVLADMKRLKVHLAIVLDEYGGTAGLVTMEDLLEEIVGDIFDEYDRAERAKPVPEDAYLLDGGLSISDFNAAHELQLDDTDYTTVGGYVFGQIGRLPRPGDRVIAGRDQFEVVEMEGRRVKSVRYILGSAGPAA